MDTATTTATTARTWAPERDSFYQQHNSTTDGNAASLTLSVCVLQNTPSTASPLSLSLSLRYPGVRMMWWDEAFWHTKTTAPCPHRMTVISVFCLQPSFLSLIRGTKNPPRAPLTPAFRHPTSVLLPQSLRSPSEPRHTPAASQTDTPLCTARTERMYSFHLISIVRIVSYHAWPLIPPPPPLTVLFVSATHCYYGKLLSKRPPDIRPSIHTTTLNIRPPNLACHKAPKHIS